MNEDSCSIIEDQGIVTLSQKNCPQLFYFGQYFRLINNSNGQCKWRCVKPSCNVRCITNGCSVGEKYAVEKDNDDPKSHPNHASDPIRFSRLEKRRKMREIAQNTEEAPSCIISKCVDQIQNEEAIAQSSTLDSDRQFITRIKKAKKDDYLKISQPESLKEITFPNELIKTYDDDNFLLHDSGADDAERFFIFGTMALKKNLNHIHFLSTRLDLDDPVQAKINSVYEYFEETYVGKLSQIKNGRGRNKIEEIRSKPHFAIELWNIHSRLISDIPWTTSLVESWHNAFCRILTSHTCVYSLVDWLRKEHKKTNENLIKFKTSVTANRNQEKFNIDKRR
ncbi:hypothetical protein BpHYR1_018588 [Brachionus plicatilis]|uniref:FLYWCH-type domain-containing protein n=1 Tax=Brachionus plicatilis TaxID=10195 RepID=A0A3M7PM31_BRAPC|nr:hypothetical protein BpHYR1_018588 [Brachionus plicatilis]